MQLQQQNLNKSFTYNNNNKKPLLCTVFFGIQLFLFKTHTKDPMM